MKWHVKLLLAREVVLVVGLAACVCGAPQVPLQQQQQHGGGGVGFPGFQDHPNTGGVSLSSAVQQHPSFSDVGHPGFGPHGDVGGVPLPTDVPTLEQGGVTLPVGQVPFDQGGVPLPGGPPQHVGGGGVPLPGGPPQHFGGEGGGVPLPSGPPQHFGGEGGGVPLPTGPPQHFGGVDGGVSLPSFPPQHHGGGVPLPASPAGHSGVGGVPLPTLGTGTHDTGAVGGAAGGMLGVPNPGHDQDVQRMVQMPALIHHLQAATRAKTMVKITDIISAHKQMVSGQLVYLTLRLGETRCPRGTPDPTLCQVDPTEDTHICELVVWERPWLNSTKIIHEKSRCADTEDDVDFKNYLPPIILPAASPTEVALPSLPHELDEQQVAAEAFSYIDHSSDSDFRGHLVNYDMTNIMFDPHTNMTRAQVNIEYGFTYCLKSPNQMADPRSCPIDTTRPHYLCSVFVIHSPNHVTALEVVPILDDSNDIHCEMRRLPLTSSHPKVLMPIDTQCAGCPHPVPLTDPSVLAVAEFAVMEYDRRSNEDELHTLVRLIRAHSQATSGVTYMLTAEMADTNCRKLLTGVEVNRTFCHPDPTEETEICEFHVLDQPWVPAKDLIRARCQDRHTYTTSNHDEFVVPVNRAGPTPPLLGGAQPVQLDEAGMAVVEAVVFEYNRREDDQEYHKLVKIHEATSQVTAGTTYHLVLELAETLCNKHNPTTGNGEHCPLKPREEHEICEVQVHVQPWLQTPDARRFTLFKCYDYGVYLRKTLMPEISHFSTITHPFLDDGADVAAGYQRVAPNDSSLQSVAHFVVKQYNLQEDEDELYAFMHVISALSHTVPEGTLYHLELEMAETQCKKYLPVLDPTRCPIDYSEEPEVCQAEVVVPSAPGGTLRLVKLYCDEISDYYTRRIRGKIGSKSTHGLAAGNQGGPWTDINANDPALKKLGHLIADEYDVRSDEDNLFIFFKVLKARKQVTGGIRYQLTVELQETVCPKYKRRIHKSRCVPDIGEDHMVCEANVLSQPWLRRHDISELRCAEKDDFFEGDDSVEVLYPRVHPSAHARPVFRSHFIVRGSDESEESNERFYHTFGRRNSNYDSDEDDDDDDDDDSDEFQRRLRARARARGRRSALGGTRTTNPTDPKVNELAVYALASMDQVDEDPNIRAVDKVLSARKKIVAGEEWTLTLSVVWTNCQKADNVTDVTTCEKDTSRPSSYCKVTVYLKPWEENREVSGFKCIAVDDKTVNL